MDLVGSIINPEKLSVSIPLDQQEEKSSFKCNICGEFFSRMNLLLHKITHIQETGKSNVVKNISNTGKKPSYECTVCGKIYTVRKMFTAHKNNHKRNKKLKELGIHPFDKESCLKLKASVIAASEKKSVSGSSDISKVKSEFPVKLMTDSDSTTNSSKINGSDSNVKVKLEFPEKSKIYPSVIPNPINENGFNNNSKLKPELTKNFMMNSDVTSCSLSENVSNNNFKIKSEFSENSKIYPGVNHVNVNSCNNNSKLKSESLVKLMINHDVTANPMSCDADWGPPEPAKSYNNVPPPIFPPVHVSVESSQTKRSPPIHLVSADSAQTKRSPCAKKTLYKCYVCGRSFTNKTTFANHRNNHKRNKKKQKFIFYDKPNKRNKKKAELSKQKN